MTNPQRLLNGELPESARRALRAGADIEPPPGAAEQVWAALPKAGAAGASPGRAGASPVVKLVVIGGVFAGVVAGALVLRPRSRAREQHAAGVELLAPKAVASSALSATRPVPEKAADAPAGRRGPAHAGALVNKAVAAPASPVPPGAATQRDAAAEDVAGEIALVAAARRALHSGDTARAQSLLDQCDARFPRGVLGQEREALRIETLERSGQRAAAAVRAQGFVRRYPDSPLGDRFRSLLAPAQ